jgi:hypothetical protein
MIAGICIGVILFALLLTALDICINGSVKRVREWIDPKIHDLWYRKAIGLDK